MVKEWTKTIRDRLLKFLTLGFLPLLGFYASLGSSPLFFSLLSIYISVTLLTIPSYLAIRLMPRRWFERRIMTPSVSQYRIFITPKYLSLLPFLYLIILTYGVVFFIPSYFVGTSPMVGTLPEPFVLFSSWMVPGFILMTAGVACFLAWLLAGLSRKRHSMFLPWIGLTCLTQALVLPLNVVFFYSLVPPIIAAASAVQIPLTPEYFRIATEPAILMSGLIFPKLLNEVFHMPILGSFLDVIYLSALALLAAFVVTGKRVGGVAFIHAIVLAAMLGFLGGPLMSGNLGALIIPGLMFSLIFWMIWVLWFGHFGWTLLERPVFEIQKIKANTFGVITMVLIGILILTAWIGYPTFHFMHSELQPITADFSRSATLSSDVPGLGNIGILVELRWSGSFSAEPPFITRLYKTLNLQPARTEGNVGTITITLNGKQLTTLPFDFTSGSISVPYLAGIINMRWQGEPVFSSTQASASQVPFLSFTHLETTVQSEYRVYFYLSLLSLYDHPLGSISLFTVSSQASVSVLPFEDVAIFLAMLVMVFALFSKFEVPGWDHEFVWGW
jgi:hypothetical protein